MKKVSRLNKKLLIIHIERIGIKILLITSLCLGFYAAYKSYFNVENYYSSFPQYLSFLWLLLYIPIIGVGIWGLRSLKKRLKVADPQRYTKWSSKTRKERILFIIKKFIKCCVIFILFLVVTPYIGLFIVTEHHVIYRNNTLLQKEFTAEEFGIQSNDLTITTEDGYKLWVSEVPVKKHAACVIISLSGIGQPSVTQFYPQAKQLQQHDYASFLVEVRGHGRSEGNQICLGYEEVEDIKAVISYIQQNEKYKDVPIIIQGVSMGGAIAINAFGELDSIDALIAMSAYSSVEEEVDEVMKEYKVPKLIRDFEKLIVKSALKKKFGSEKVEQMKPYLQIKKNRLRKVLLIGARGDTSVPIGNLYRLQKAYPEAEVWIKDSWEHFIIDGCDYRQIENDTEYCKRILDFIENVIETSNKKEG